MTPPPASTHGWRLAARCWLAAIAACGLFGLGVARLTVGLNSHVNDSLPTVLLLFFYGLCLYGLVGLVVGGFAAASALLLTRMGGLGRRLASWCPAITGAAPLVFFLLLPQVGLGGQLLSDLLWSASGSRLALPLLVLVGGVVALAGLVQWLPSRWRTPRRWALAWHIVAILLVLSAGEPGPRPPIFDEQPVNAKSPLATSPAAPVPTAEQWIAAGEQARARGDEARAAPAPVLLLCIDGADLRVIEELVDRGELPAFGRLMAEGTWGRLATLEPTLSPIIWTTLITGQTPEQHGIRHFLHFRLPGLKAPIYQFPLHTGLNFRLFPLLRKIPGMPSMQATVTSGMRRSLALWHMVDRLHKVGVYRWLMTWPAEPVRGFFVSGGIGWVQPDARHDSVASQPAVYPPALSSELPKSPAAKPSAAELAAFVGEGFDLEPTDDRLRPIYGQYRDPTIHQLPWLLDRFQPKFTAAAFYPVDAAHHLFTEYRGRGGVFSDAVDQAYRLTDRRLGELLEQVAPSTQVLVVSDHGYDFAGNHHTHAPPGIFMARGPAFEAGRRVDELSVFDVAPLVLRLLDMPLPMDLPGSQSRAYEAALSEPFASQHPAAEIQSYESRLGRPELSSGEDFPDEAELRQLLEALGYVE